MSLTPAFSNPATWYHVFLSRVFLPCHLVPRFPLPRFPPLHFRPCLVFHSRVFSRPGSKVRDPKLIICVINFELVRPLCPRYLNVTGRRTDKRSDGRHTIAIPRFELCASRGKNYIRYWSQSLSYEIVDTLSQYWPQLVNNNKSDKSTNTVKPTWIFVVDEQSFNEEKENIGVLQQAEHDIITTDQPNSRGKRNISWRLLKTCSNSHKVQGQISKNCWKFHTLHSNFTSV